MVNKTKVRKKETPEERYKRLADKIISGELVAYLAQLHIPMLLQVFEEGYHVAHFCNMAEISEMTFYHWLDHYPEFKSAYTLAKVMSRSYYEAVGTKGIHDEHFNSKVWEIVMRNKHGYTDKRKLSIDKIAEAKTALEQFKCIIRDVEQGKLTADEAATLTNIVSSGINILEKTELAKDVEMLKEHLPKASQ
jgi:hypothetical protein